MPNLISLTCPCLQTLGKISGRDISYLRISSQSLVKENWYNSRTSDDVDMKLGPVNKLDKRNKTTFKKMTMTLCQKIVTSLPFFGFMADLEESGSRIPGA